MYKEKKKMNPKGAGNGPCLKKIIVFIIDHPGQLSQEFQAGFEPTTSRLQDMRSTTAHIRYRSYLVVAQRQNYLVKRLKLRPVWSDFVVRSQLASFQSKAS